MPIKTDITVHCIAQTRCNRAEMRAWLDRVGATEYPWDGPASEPTDIGEFQLVASDATVLIGNAAKSCYRSFEPGLNPNVTKVRRDWTQYFDNVLKSGHGSVTEHASWTFAIDGCTRVMTAEFNRHRAGVAISENSLRYIRFSPDTIPYWEPLSLQGCPGDDLKLLAKKKASREVFERAFQSSAGHYAELMDIWKDELAPDSKFAAKKAITSTMRRVIPMGVSTGAIYTLNARALRHIIALRCSPAAEEEIAYVVGMIAVRMFEQEKHLFGDFTKTPEGFWVPEYPKV